MHEGFGEREEADSSHWFGVVVEAEKAEEVESVDQNSSCACDDVHTVAVTAKAGDVHRRPWILVSQHADGADVPPAWDVGRVTLGFALVEVEGVQLRLHRRTIL